MSRSVFYGLSHDCATLCKTGANLCNFVQNLIPTARIFTVQYLAKLPCRRISEKPVRE